MGIFRTCSVDGRNVELRGEASEAKQDRIRRRDIKVARLLFEDGGREREQRVEGEMDGCEGRHQAASLVVERQGCRSRERQALLSAVAIDFIIPCTKYGHLSR